MQNQSTILEKMHGELEKVRKLFFAKYTEWCKVTWHYRQVPRSEIRAMFAPFYL